MPKSTKKKKKAKAKAKARVKAQMRAKARAKSKAKAAAKAAQKAKSIADSSESLHNADKAIDLSGDAKNFNNNALESLIDEIDEHNNEKTGSVAVAVKTETPSQNAETVEVEELQVEEIEFPKTINKSRKKCFRKILAAAVSALAVVLFLSLIFIVYCSQSVFTEVCQRPDYSKISENSFVGSLCKIETDISKIDTTHPNDIKVKLKFFGFIKGESYLRIADTKKPLVEPIDVFATVGTELKEQMFVKSVKDQTDVTFKFLSDTDTTTAKEERVFLSAVDESGNKTEFSANLTVIDTKDTLVFEYGVKGETIISSLISFMPDSENIDISSVGGCGIFIVKSISEKAAYYATVTVKDTIPPVVKVNSFDILLGNKISDEKIVSEIIDNSPVKTVFKKRADFNTVGEHVVETQFTDSFGNVTECTSYIRIHELNNNVTAEVGADNGALGSLIFKDDFSKKNLSFVSEKALEGLSIGKHEIKLKGKFSAFTVTVNLEDTIPPVISLTPRSFVVYSNISADSFVSSCKDNTKVTYSFKQKPDNSKEGTFPVTIIAKDAAGNKTEADTKVTFFYDTVPPVISGVIDRSISAGKTVDYLAGVSAYDSVCGAVKVVVDSSAVKTDVPGSYEVFYYATDASGNKATKTSWIYVREAKNVRLNVANIMQMPTLPNGCEVVSLAIALRYYGYSIAPVDLYDKFMPKSSYNNGNPWYSYLGDAKGQGMGCYAPCVVKTGNDYLASVGSSKRVADVSWNNMSYYKKLIDNGTPVIMWGLINMNCNSATCWSRHIDGKSVVWHSSSHCLVLIGYTDDTYIFCDPLRGIVEYSASSVEKSFKINFQQACIIQ